MKQIQKSKTASAIMKHVQDSKAATARADSTLLPEALDIQKLARELRTMRAHFHEGVATGKDQLQRRKSQRMFQPSSPQPIKSGILRQDSGDNKGLQNKNSGFSRQSQRALIEQAGSWQ